MMDKNIKDIIKDLAPDNTSLLSKICEVISVNVEDKTCVLKPLDGSAEISQVFLTADENSSVFFEPTVKSLVCVVFITKTSGVVVSWSQLKQFNIKYRFNKIRDAKEAKEGVLNVINIGEQNDEKINFGTPTENSGAQALKSIIAALKDMAAHKAQVFVTAPIDNNIDDESKAYCELSSTFPWQEWIGKVSFGTINHNSFKESYGDFVNISTDINKGTSTGSHKFSNGDIIESYSPVDGKLIGKVKATTKEDYEKVMGAATTAFKTK